jgi:hypothetical protein
LRFDVTIEERVVARENVIFKLPTVLNRPNEQPKREVALT